MPVCSNYEPELAASAQDTRRRQGRRIALTATRYDLGEVGEGGRDETPQTHPRTQGIERDARVERQGRAAGSFVSPPPSRGSWCSALPRRAEVSPSTSREPPPRPPSPPPAACRAATRPSGSSGVGDGNGRFWAGISRQGPHDLPAAAAAFPSRGAGGVGGRRRRGGGGGFVDREESVREEGWGCGNCGAEAEAQGRAGQREKGREREEREKGGTRRDAPALLCVVCVRVRVAGLTGFDEGWTRQTASRPGERTGKARGVRDVQAGGARGAGQGCASDTAAGRWRIPSGAAACGRGSSRVEVVECTVEI
ncbi:hypothetical protein SETIT_5G347800v2 [Setaria italica]|uniref:Uncharacterized protein n=1 Tax=Setaria italica TaxID=4555 RepID=A0A368RC26_SETIT|nr:hypothetical protein SETIT_5G347800v2 [Setaria italica]